MTVEIISLDLEYGEICTLLESSTVQPESLLHNKLKAAREAFERKPKVYGQGYGIKVRESK
jgi:hypothetical protein